MSDLPIRRLVARRTLEQIGAGLRMGTGSERAEWRISKPPGVDAPGPYYLGISRDNGDGYTVTILRDGEGRSVETLAIRERVADLDVDDVVLDLYFQRGEASGGS